jgi:methyl-galactoside transport system substrate-binding protein
MAGTITQDPAAVAEAIYKVGMNLVNGKNPIENTSYQLDNKKIVSTTFYQEYVKQHQ